MKYREKKDWNKMIRVSVSCGTTSSSLGHQKKFFNNGQISPKFDENYKSTDPRNLN